MVAKLFYQYFTDGVILGKQKLVTLNCLRHSVLRLAGKGHIGIVKWKARYRSKVWWPNIGSEISSFISEYHSCQITLDHHQPASMISIPMLVSLWLSVAPFPTVEILLILVDCYFRFPFVKILKSTTSAKNFLEHGLPKTLRSDYWVQFTSNEMEYFFKSMVLPIIALHCYGPK